MRFDRRSIMAPIGEPINRVVPEPTLPGLPIQAPPRPPIERLPLRSPREDFLSIERLDNIPKMRPIIPEPTLPGLPPVIPEPSLPSMPPVVPEPTLPSMPPVIQSPVTPPNIPMKPPSIGGIGGINQDFRPLERKTDQLFISRLDDPVMKQPQ